MLVCVRVAGMEDKEMTITRIVQFRGKRQVYQSKGVPVYSLGPLRVDTVRFQDVLSSMSFSEPNGFCRAVALHMPLDGDAVTYWTEIA